MFAHSRSLGVQRYVQDSGLSRSANSAHFGAKHIANILLRAATLGYAFLATSGHGVESPVHGLSQIRARLIPGKSKSKASPEGERCLAFW